MNLGQKRELGQASVSENLSLISGGSYLYIFPTFLQNCKWLKTLEVYYLCVFIFVFVVIYAIQLNAYVYFLYLYLFAESLFCRQNSILWLLETEKGWNCCLHLH